MVESTDSLESQLLTLPPAARARLVEVLLASLDQEVESGPAAEVEAAWMAEAERRLAELREGSVAGVPVAKVFAAVRERRTKE
jgi:putative addiction module component (TIGR02574 family)